MKKLVFSMLAIAAMVSCTSESDPINEVNKEKVEIKLTAGVIATTKAAINEVPEAGLGVMFLRAVDADQADWATATPLFAKITKPTDLTFYTAEDYLTESKQYYNADVALKSWLVGYYLGGLTATPDEAKKNEISFTITGDEDILATEGLSGTKAAAFKNFSFNHMLSQVQIVLKGDAAAAANFGKITKVELTDLATSLKLTLGASSAIALSGLEDQAIVVYTDGTGKDLTPSGVTLDNVPMIYKTGNKIGIKVTSAEGGESTLEAGITGNGFEPGKKHVITLSFKEKLQLLLVSNHGETVALVLAKLNKNSPNSI